MSRGRHAAARPPRSDTPLAVLVVVLAAGVFALTLVADDFTMVRWAIAGLAVLCVLTVGVIRTSSRSTVRIIEMELWEARAETQSVWLEVSLLREGQHELVLEIAALRESVSDYVAPVPKEPDVIYPSLHVPLVRAAFAEEFMPDQYVPALTVTDEVEQVDQVPVSVSGNGHADPEAPRRLLDLTASEIAELRHAN